MTRRCVTFVGFHRIPWAFPNGLRMRNPVPKRFLWSRTRRESQRSPIQNPHQTRALATTLILGFPSRGSWVQIPSPAPARIQAGRGFRLASHFASDASAVGIANICKYALWVQCARMFAACRQQSTCSNNAPVRFASSRSRCSRRSSSAARRRCSSS